MSKNWVVVGLLVLAGLTFVGLCIGGCGFFIYWSASSVGEMTTATDEFFALVAQGKDAEAYNVAASGLRSQQSQEEFSATVKRLGLKDYAASSFPSFNIHNNVGTLTGTITTKTGGTIPITVTLVKESGKWRVLSVESGGSAGSNATAKAAKPAIPSDDELRRLTTATMKDFDKAVRTGDFNEFHGKIATLWQQEATSEKFKEGFKSVLEKKDVYPDIKDAKPVFDEPPSFDDKEFLVLKGYYPTKPAPLQFRVKYTYEHPTWKLVGLYVNVQQ